MNRYIYSIANSGGRLYPASVCLQMILEQKKDYYPIYKLENISGHPYGWFYLNHLIVDKGEEIEISPGTEMTNSIKLACRVLGYNFEHCVTDEWNKILNFIKSKIQKNNPVILGPVAHCKLKYQISGLRAPAVASHYLVIVGYDEKFIYFHDPNGMSYIPFTYEQIRDVFTEQVKIPGSKRFSAITVEERYETPTEVEVFKRVIDNAIKSYEEKEVRFNGYVGLHAIQKYAEDIIKFLGANNKSEKEMILRKLALYFYPKGNQIRSDAISYMNYISEYIPNIKDIIDNFCSVFMKASIIYKEDSELLMPKIVKFDEKDIESTLSILQKHAYKIYDLEKEAYKCIVKIKEELKD
ncbi:hypothetical protein [Clostridium sporogenes]|uniref:hypothetical protein n=1 Tax=Clostridium sporogenes TaxID=1509 RepID=UPI0006B2827A|nr:hypothetical protein [Clostridium sporogenes]KOY65420.1 hypothetical protein AN649_13150 [Clostridium sporogenes]MDS1006648.1 hypothetical protein [Clostridium sporogenes]